MKLTKVISIFVLFWSFREVPSCDYFSQVIALKCASQLVNFFEPKQFTLHPKLHEIEKFCVSYGQYRKCSSIVSRRCRAAVASWLENLYDHICGQENLRKLRAQQLCFKRMAGDNQLQSCYSNATVAIRKHSWQNHTGVTMFDEACDTMQSHLNCLQKREYLDRCPFASELQLELFDHLAPECGFKYDEVKIENPVENYVNGFWTIVEWSTLIFAFGNIPLIGFCVSVLYNFRIHELTPGFFHIQMVQLVNNLGLVVALYVCVIFPSWQWTPSTFYSLPMSLTQMIDTVLWTLYLSHVLLQIVCAVNRYTTVVLRKNRWWTTLTTYSACILFCILALITSCLRFLCHVRYEPIRPPLFDAQDQEEESELIIDQQTSPELVHGLGVHLMASDLQCHTVYRNLEMTLRLGSATGCLVMYIATVAKFYLLKPGVYPELRRQEGPLTVCALVMSIPGLLLAGVASFGTLFTDMSLQGHGPFATVSCLIVISATMTPLCLMGIIPPFRKSALKLIGIGKVELPKESMFGKMSDSLYKYAYNTHL